MKIQKGRIRTTVCVIAAIILITWLGVTLGGSTTSTQTAAKAPPRAAPQILSFPEGAPQLAMIQVQALPMSQMPLAETLPARVAYDEDVTARISVGFAGRIVDLKAAPGQTVRSGQILAEIDSPDVGTATSDFGKARADEERKRQIAERARELGPGEAIAAKDWESAQADYAQARAETARAEQRILNMNPHKLAIHGQRVSLASPLHGVITERSATPALEVSPSLTAPLFVVSDPHRLWLMVDLPERLLSLIKMGSAIDIESDAWPGQHFTARIAQLPQTIDPNTRRAVIRATLQNPDARLLPEMFVRATILQDSGSGVRVPNNAIVHDGVQSFVFVESAPGQFRRRQVTVQDYGNENSFVVAGLNGGERVVTGGALLLDAELKSSGDQKP